MLNHVYVVKFIWINIHLFFMILMGELVRYCLLLAIYSLNSTQVNIRILEQLE